VLGVYGHIALGRGLAGTLALIGSSGSLGHAFSLVLFPRTFFEPIGALNCFGTEVPVAFIATVRRNAKSSRNSVAAGMGVAEQVDFGF
jgi:hypothetical protein